MFHLWEYSDVCYRPVSLSMEEREWFLNKISVAQERTGIKVPIFAYNHELYEEEHSEALGCYCAESKNYSERDYITIDTYFIHECYLMEVKKDFVEIMLLNGETMNKVLAHELAHSKCWEHGEIHDKYTSDLLTMIEQ